MKDILTEKRKYNHMKSNKTNTLKTKLKIFRINTTNFMKTGLRRTATFIAHIFSIIQLPIIIIFAILVIGLIVIFLIFPQWAYIGEAELGSIINKLELFGVLLTAISLLAAAITIILAIQKPKLKIVFYSDHGSAFDYRKGELELGIDETGCIGYQACVPSKWNMNLINIGRKTAEKIKIKFVFDNIYFDGKLVEHGYDLEGFQYGCGIFSSISFEVTNLLRQGEQIAMPDLPFYLSVCDSDLLQKQGYTYLKIYIYSGNHEPTVMKCKVSIKDYDLPSHNYSLNEEYTLRYLEYEQNFWNWYKHNHNTSKDMENLYYNFYKELEPYRILSYPNIGECKSLYWYYKDKDIDKMLFWGRVYYQAIGMPLYEAEALLQTELLRISTSGIKKKEGHMSII